MLYVVVFVTRYNLLVKTIHLMNLLDTSDCKNLSKRTMNMKMFHFGPPVVSLLVGTRRVRNAVRNHGM